MKARLIISLVIALMLVAVLALPAMAANPSEITASVTVNVYISCTITDNGDGGLDFGSLNPGDTDEAEAAQDGAGAVTMVVAAETNVDCDINVKATDFTCSTYTIAITNAKYGITSTLGSATAFAAADTYYTLDSSTALTAKTVDVWHWLDIPSVQEAGDYASTFTYQVIKTP